MEEKLLSAIKNEFPYTFLILSPVTLRLKDGAIEGQNPFYKVVGVRKIPMTSLPFKITLAVGLFFLFLTADVLYITKNPTYLLYILDGAVVGFLFYLSICRGLVSIKVVSLITAINFIGYAFLDYFLKKGDPVVFTYSAFAGYIFSILYMIYASRDENILLELTSLLEWNPEEKWNPIKSSGYYVIVHKTAFEDIKDTLQGGTRWKKKFSSTTTTLQ